MVDVDQEWVTRFCVFSNLKWPEFGLLSVDGHTLFISAMDENKIVAIHAGPQVSSENKIKFSSRSEIIAGSGEARNSDGPALEASIHSPGSLCFDSATFTPESVLFIASYHEIRILSLIESANDVLDRRLRPWIESDVWFALLYDLWFIIADYAIEPPTLRTLPGTFETPRYISSTPCGDLIVSSGPTLLRVDSLIGSTSVLLRDCESIRSISGLAIDNTDRCVYIADLTNESILRVRLPSDLFAQPRRPCPRFSNLVWPTKL